MTGGDQNRILDSIAAFPRIDLAAKIRARFQAGIPFAGTSAGTAIVSSIALRGDTGTRPGLDLLPTSIVDQHFITRGREPRLKSALALHPGLIGVGVEEGSAVAIRGGERFETFGPAPLTIIRDGMTELLRRAKVQRSGLWFRRFLLDPPLGTEDDRIRRSSSRTWITDIFKERDLQI